MGRGSGRMWFAWHAHGGRQHLRPCSPNPCCSTTCSTVRHALCRQADKRKSAKLGDGDGDDDEALRDAAVEQEFERAKERLTLKHKNTSK